MILCSSWELSARCARNFQCLRIRVHLFPFHSFWKATFKHKLAGKRYTSMRLHRFQPYDIPIAYLAARLPQSGLWLCDRWRRLLHGRTWNLAIPKRGKRQPKRMFVESTVPHGCPGPDTWDALRSAKFLPLPIVHAGRRNLYVVWSLLKIDSRLSHFCSPLQTPGSLFSWTRIPQTC